MLDRFKTWIAKKALRTELEKPIRHTFENDDREKSALVRRENALKRQQLEMMEQRLAHLQELQKMEQMQEKINALEDNLYGDEEEGESPDSLLYGLLSKAFGVGGQSQPIVPPTPNTTEQQELSDETLTAMIESVPAAQIAIMRRLDDAELQRLAKQKFPYLNDATIQKAIKLVRGI